MATEGGQPYIIWFSDPESANGAKVGGKNASLGEMTQKLHEAGIAVPAGCAISVAAVRTWRAHRYPGSPPRRFSSSAVTTTR